MIAGGLLGAIAAYLLDPTNGSQRRRYLRELVEERLAAVRPSMGSRPSPASTPEVANLAPMSHAPNAAVGGSSQDAVITDRIMSSVMGAPDVPTDRLALDVVDGIVTLRGELDSSEEIDDLGTRIANVDGVVEVKALVHLPGEPAPNKASALRASREAGEDTGSSSGSAA
jgi:osmotically-inducible protein OsmY